MSEFEKDYNPSYDYLLKKSIILIEKFDKITEAINILEGIEEDNYNRNNLLIQLYSISNQKDLAKKIADKYAKTDIELLFTYHLEFKEYETVCTIIEEHWKINKKEVSAFVSYSYAKLKLGEYEKIYRELKQYYDNPQTCTPEILINYFIADINYNKLDEKKIKNKILSNKELYNNSVIAAAYSLIGDIPNAIDYLSKAIKEDNMLKYSVRDWPAFDNCKKEPRFLRIVGLS